MTGSSALDDAAVLWSAEREARTDRPLLLLLHGYGADENDLFALAPHLPEAFVFAAVRAPLAPPWPAGGYSWYPIEGLESRDARHITAAADGLLAWVDALPNAPVIGLLGFSQGAAVSIQAMRLRPERFAFVVNLSGYATPGDLEGDAALTRLRPPVFWGRGTRDDVIPPFLVDHTVQWLPEHSDLSGRVYTGLTHSVSQDELDDVRAFLLLQLEEKDAADAGGTGGR